MDPLIQEANLPKALELILIILIVYYAFSFIIRYIVPSLMRKYMNNMQQRFTGENQRTQEEQTRKKEGEISIKYINKDKDKNHNPPDDGDYVDYEEIK